MLPDILSNVKENLEKASILNEKQISILIDNMKFWKVNNLIYPAQVKSLLFIDYKKTYQVLEIIKNLGILEYNYELYCSKCEKFIDKKPLRSLNEFPQVLYCDENHRMDPFNDVILIFRVIFDGK